MELSNASSDISGGGKSKLGVRKPRKSWSGVLKDGSRELRRGKVVQAFLFLPLAAFAFRIGESARLSTKGGSTVTITLSRLRFSTPRAPSSGSGRVRGRGVGRKQRLDRLSAGGRGSAFWVFWIGSPGYPDNPVDG